jgi:two-component system, sensor histidine kinase RegB
VRLDVRPALEGRAEAVSSEKSILSRFWQASDEDSQLRLQTIVRLRWLAVLGQLAVIGVVALVLEFRLPVGWCLFLTACSAWLNVFLAVKFPARHRLSARLATALLGYDIVQLAALLFFTGGVQNPFTMLLVVPVTVSAATLPPRHTVALAFLASVATLLIATTSYPLPWYPSEPLDHPVLYDLGIVAAVISTMLFMALYARRLTREGKLMSAALTATELVLAREQKLHALDGLAAAAAHELGTPLSTIVLVTKEMQAGLPKDSLLAEDVELLRQQALRCREILQKLTKHPTEQDPLHGNISMQEMLEEASAPYANDGKPIHIFVHPASGMTGTVQDQPLSARKPGVLYGLGNLIENAVDFARGRVDLTGEWDQTTVSVTLTDDGPGFAPEIIDTLGEPYVTSRPMSARKTTGKAGGLGLGFFIAKTLLERSGARVMLENKLAPQRGAVVRLVWPRDAFEAGAERAGPGTAVPRPQLRPAAIEVYDR